MNIKIIRNIHLYLGCFFAPALIFFILTGIVQTFNLHRGRKDGSYTPPAIVKALSEVHMSQRYVTSQRQVGSSKGFQYFVLVMGMGILLTTILGIVMAFKFTKSLIVWVCLGLGIGIPVYLIWQSYFH